MTDPDTFTDQTVSEIRDDVADIDDPEVLETLRDAEEAAKDRKTAKEAIDERLDALDTDDTDVETEADDEPDDEDDVSGHIRVRPAPNIGGGHIAGYSFDEGEIKLLPAEAKVKKALMRGKLQHIA